MCLGRLTPKELAEAKKIDTELGALVGMLIYKGRNAYED